MKTTRPTPSRRTLMRWSASALLAADLWPGRAFAADKPAGGPFDFFIINDLHYMTPECGKWLEKVVASMKAQKAKPEFCVIAGDLTDGGLAAHFAVVRDVFKTLNMPVHVMPGNHDHVKGNDRRPFEQIFPKQTNYTFEHKGWQFVALDSTDGTKSQCAVLKPTLDYVDATLPKLDKAKPTLLVTHFPMGPGVKMRSENADALLDRFKPLNLAGVFGGHFHSFTETTVRDIPVKTNKCCSLKRANHDGTKEKGYFLCTAKDGKVTPTFVEMKQG